MKRIFIENDHWKLYTKIESIKLSSVRACRELSASTSRYDFSPFYYEKSTRSDGYLYIKIKSTV